MSQIIPDHTNTHITTLNEPHYTRLQRHTLLISVNQNTLDYIDTHTLSH